MNDAYEEFVAMKSASVAFDGIDGAEIDGRLFPHQRDLVTWALRKGRAAVFADTGLGKTLMQLEWARVVSARGRVLVLTPLAVAQQTVREAERFGIGGVEYCREDTGARITVANYEMMHAFDPAAFVGVVLDESSILKSFNGATRTALINAFARTPYRLACTATPAPNDHTELGNHSEFLGIKTRTEMLAEYFVHDGETTQEWRIKGHAQAAFWRWVCSWGAIVRKPSDLGHDDGAYALPPLRTHEHVIPVDHGDAKAAGRLFLDDARSLSDQRATRRATMEKRVAKAVELAAGDEPCLIWCELNDEGNALEDAIPGAVQVSGADSAEDKADRLLGFAEGRYRVLVTKASVAGFGLNFQSCARMVFVGASHSYEQTYQAMRRCWRFGQTRPVDVHVIRAETEGAVLANLRRKEADAARMSEEVASRAMEFMRAEIGVVTKREWNDYAPSAVMVIPEWLGQEEAA
jgi:superfamily II DNA or RNA helicase